MERLFAYLTDLSGGVAYLLIFGILVACGLGFPLPEDIPLIATGYLIWDGTMTWVWGILVTMLGVLIGDSLLFWIGHRLG
ncbi:DedA family protein, partial [bacterium]|nr:DedA family protein [bacterium]